MRKMLLKKMNIRFVFMKHTLDSQVLQIGITHKNKSDCLVTHVT